MPYAAALELEHEQGVVFPICKLAVNQVRAPGHHLANPVLLADEVPRGLYAVAAKVVESTPAGEIDVPEVRAVRTAMRFPRAYPEDSPHAAVLDDLSCLHHRRCEYLCFRISVHGSGSPGCVEHLPG